MARNRNNGGQVKQGDQTDSPQESAQQVATEGAAIATAEPAASAVDHADAAGATQSVSGEQTQAAAEEQQATATVSEPVVSESPAQAENAATQSAASNGYTRLVKETVQEPDGSTRFVFDGDISLVLNRATAEQFVNERILVRSVKRGIEFCEKWKLPIDTDMVDLKFRIQGMFKDAGEQLRESLTPTQDFKQPYEMLGLNILAQEHAAEAGVHWAEAEVVAGGDDDMAFDVLCDIATADAKYPRGDVKCRRDAQRAIERCAAKSPRFLIRAHGRSEELKAVGVELPELPKE